MKTWQAPACLFSKWSIPDRAILIAAGQLLLLLLIANGAPIIAQRLFGHRAGWPLDGGRRLSDGQPWFGSSKTVRGIAAAVLACAIAAPLLGVSVLVGVLIAAGAMAGDLLSSFIKRRLGIPPSGRMPGLDQLPESVLPTLLAGGQLGLSPAWGLAVVLMFVVLELILARILYALHIRRRPY